MKMQKAQKKIYRERDIERALVSRVEAIGGLVRKVQWVGRRGAPDRLVLLPDGRQIWVELKRPGGRADPHQQRELARLAAYGLDVRLVDTLEAVDELVGGNDRVAGAAD